LIFPTTTPDLVHVDVVPQKSAKINCLKSLAIVSKCTASRDAITYWFLFESLWVISIVFFQTKPHFGSKRIFDPAHLD